jgi:hypothetical protein
MLRDDNTDNLAGNVPKLLLERLRDDNTDNLAGNVPQLIYTWRD